MHTPKCYLSALVLALVIPGQVRAQTTAAPGTLGTVATDTAKVMTDALKLRGDTVDAIAGGNTTIADAVKLLRASGSSSGLNLDADADFAFAAVDVALRLIAAGKPTPAEQLFREAEKALVVVINKTPDSSASSKAMYLAEAATIRARYLGNPVQAKADIEAALKLQPDDAYLKQLHGSLANDKAQIFNVTPQG